MASGSIDIKALLQNLIESAEQSWNYSIFWHVTPHCVQGSLLGMGDWYFNDKEHKGKETNSSSSSSISIAERDDPILLFCELNSLLPEPQESTVLDAAAEEVTHRLWLSFLIHSLVQRFAKGSGLPGQAWQSLSPVWISGMDNVASSSCERARKAQEVGLRTLVFIPSETGVIELGSTALNFQRMDLVNKAVQLMNFIYGLKMFQSGRESGASNSIGKSALLFCQGPSSPKIYQSPRLLV